MVNICGLLMVGGNKELIDCGQTRPADMTINFRTPPPHHHGGQISDISSVKGNVPAVYRN